MSFFDALILLAVWTVTVIVSDCFREFAWKLRGRFFRGDMNDSRLLPALRFIWRQRDGEALPPWYLIAYYDIYTDTAVCLPMPLNFIVRWVRGLWWWFLEKTLRSKLDRRMKALRDDVYRDGYNAGWARRQETMLAKNREPQP